MRRAILLVAIAVGGCAGRDGVQETAVFADPFEQVIAAERGFSALAQSAGQWTAFRATAHPDALMFAPQPVRAHDFLAGRADPPRSVRWWPAKVAVSCDGSTAVSTGGAIYPNGSGSRFTTIWRRQGDGRWLWLADQGAPRSPVPVEPTQVERIAADCTAPLAVPPSAASIDGGLGSSGGGESPDGSLRWHWTVDPAGALDFVVDLRQDGRYVRVIDDRASRGGEG
jgi:hypothetical protein